MPNAQTRLSGLSSSDDDIKKQDDASVEHKEFANMPSVSAGGVDLKVVEVVRQLLPSACSAPADRRAPSRADLASALILFRPSQFNAQYAAAIKAERLDPRSRESWMLYFCCGVSFLCACANGYDGSLMTALIAMAPVRRGADQTRNLYRRADTLHRLRLF